MHVFIEFPWLKETRRKARSSASKYLTPNGLINVQFALMIF